MSPLVFAAKYIGQVVTAPGGDGGQCVDLANIWLAANRGTPPVRLNAVDWATTAIRSWKWIANTPQNSPARGSLVVWGQNAAVGTGQYGHIAIALTADSAELVTLDQDWPFGSPVALTLHSYEGVLGWWQAGG